MDQFTLTIIWRNGTSGVENKLSWTDVILWMEQIHTTASQDLVKTVMITQDGVDYQLMLKKHMHGCNHAHENYQPCTFGDLVAA